jgi:hypothetical protein
MARDHRATYQRRVAKARERGFTGYGQQRGIRQRAGEHSLFDEAFGEEPPDLDNPDDVRKLRALHRLQTGGGTADADYSPGSAKNILVVEILGVMTQEEFEAAYPDGKRHRHRVRRIAA